MFGLGAMNLEAILRATGMIEPDLPSGALSSKQFNTIVELLGEGELEGSATASKAGITDKTSTAYFNAFKKDIFLNGTQILQEAASNTAPEDSDFNFSSSDSIYSLRNGWKLFCTKS